MHRRACSLLAALAFTAPPLAAAEPPPTRAIVALDCRGEEPFWRVRVKPEGATMERLSDVGRPAQVFAGALTTFGFLQPPWLAWRGAAPEAGGVLTVVARQEPCRSTMADGPPVEFRAVVTFPSGESAVGCCAATRTSPSTSVD